MALAECCFGQSVGARIGLPAEPAMLPEFLLFGEDATRIVVSCDPAMLLRIQESAVKYGVAAIPIGETVSQQFSISAGGKPLVEAAVSELKDCWEHALEAALHVETEERLVPNALQKS